MRSPPQKKPRHNAPNKEEQLKTGEKTTTNTVTELNEQIAKAANAQAVLRLQNQLKIIKNQNEQLAEGNARNSETMARIQAPMMRPTLMQAAYPIPPTYPVPPNYTIPNTANQLPPASAMWYAQPPQQIAHQFPTYPTANPYYPSPRQFPHG